MHKLFLAALFLTALSGSAIAQSASTPVDNSVLSQTNSGTDANNQQTVALTTSDGKNAIAQAIAQPTSSSVSTTMNVSTVSPSCTMANCGQTVLGFVLQTAIDLANKK